MRRRSILTILLAGALWVVVPASKTFAQAEIPQDIIKASNLTPTQSEVVTKFVKDRVEKLADEDPAVMKKSRDELLQPFKAAGGVSVAFRQAFSDAATPELTKLLSNKADRVVVNSLRTLGDIATTASSDNLVQRLGDPRPAVRYAAVNGLERTMAAIAMQSPAIPLGNAQALTSKLADVIKDPKGAGPEVLDAAVRALNTAMQVKQANYAPLRDSAFRSMAEGIEALLAKNANVAVPDAVQQVLVRVALSTRDGLSPRDPELELKGDSVDQAAALCGHLLGWVYCQIQAKQMLPAAAGDDAEQIAAKKEARKTAAKIIRQAESSILVVSQKKGIPIAAPNLVADFEQASADGDRSFFRKLVELVQQLKGPMKLEKEEFLRCAPTGG